MSFWQRWKQWSRESDLEYRRSKPVRVVVEIPYSENNAKATAGVQVAAVQLVFTDALNNVTVDKIPLEGVIVRCTHRPDWRNL